MLLLWVDGVFCFCFVVVLVLLLLLFWEVGVRLCGLFREWLDGVSTHFTEFTDVGVQTRVQIGEAGVFVWGVATEGMFFYTG